LTQLDPLRYTLKNQFEHIATNNACWRLRRIFLNKKPKNNSKNAYSDTTCRSAHAAQCPASEQSDCTETACLLCVCRHLIFQCACSAAMGLICKRRTT
jgi:hypothetical protein